MIFETTITREKNNAEVEIAVFVKYSYHPPSKGHRDKYGAPEEPDEPESFEIELVWEKETDNEIELTEKEALKIEKQIWVYENHLI